MEFKKYSLLAAIMMLIMVFNPVYCGSDNEFPLPDAPKSEAQAYYDQVPVESEFNFFFLFLFFISYNETCISEIFPQAFTYSKLNLKSSFN